MRPQLEEPKTPKVRLFVYPGREVTMQHASSLWLIFIDLAARSSSIVVVQTVEPIFVILIAAVIVVVVVVTHITIVVVVDLMEGM